MSEEKTKKTKKQKEGTGWQRFKNWGNEHLPQILCGILLAGGAAAGIMLTKDAYYSKGYGDGLIKYRKDHIDLAKNLIDDCGREGAFQALNYVRKDENNYKELMDNPGEVIGKVAEFYYGSDMVSNLLQAFDGEMEVYNKLGKK